MCFFNGNILWGQVSFLPGSLYGFQLVPSKWRYMVPHCWTLVSKLIGSMASLMLILFLVGVPIAMLNEVTQLAVLLGIAGVGYVVQSFAAFLGYNVNIILVTGLGELVFLLWLLIKGVNVEQWKKRALESA